MAPLYTTNGSYLFNAEAENLLINHADMALGSGDWTIDWWFKILGTPSSNNWFFSIGTENADGIQCYYTQSGNQLNFWDIGGNGSMRFALTNHGSETGEWYHVRFCRNGNNHYVFINGNCIGGSASNGSIITTGTSWTRSYTHAPAANDCRIGAYYGGNYGWEDGMLMSDFRIIKGTSLQTSAAQFNVPTTASTAVSGTVLLTCQNSTGAATVDNSGTSKTISIAQGTVTPDSRKVPGVSEDKSSSSHTITKTGDVVHSYATPFSQSSGGSIYFDGGGTGSAASEGAADWISGVITPPGTSDFTVECWVYLTTQDPDPYQIQAVFGMQQNAFSGSGAWGTTGAGMYFRGGSHDYVGILANGTFHTASGGLPVAQTWTHVAFIKTGGYSRMFVGGTKRAELADTTNYSSESHLAIGGYYNTQISTFNGYISNFRYHVGTPPYTISSGTTITPPTSALTAISGTKLLTANDSNVINDASSEGISLTANGDAIATRFNPF